MSDAIHDDFCTMYPDMADYMGKSEETGTPPGTFQLSMVGLAETENLWMSLDRVLTDLDAEGSEEI